VSRCAEGAIGEVLIIWQNTKSGRWHTPDPNPPATREQKVIVSGISTLRYHNVNDLKHHCNLQVARSSTGFQRARPVDPPLVVIEGVAWVSPLARDFALNRAFLYDPPAGYPATLAIASPNDCTDEGKDDSAIERV
jgi:hypothetical protein